MNIVENKHGKFDIDTVEGAEKYLESEGVNVAEYLQKGIEELKRHNKILNIDEADTSHKSKVLNIPRVTNCKKLQEHKLGDFDIWYAPCKNCGYDTGKSRKLEDARCWRCGQPIKRDFSERALKKEFQ